MLNFNVLFQMSFEGEQKGLFNRKGTFRRNDGKSFFIEHNFLFQQILNRTVFLLKKRNGKKE
jgi:hypothetical protein